MECVVPNCNDEPHEHPVEQTDYWERRLDTLTQLIHNEAHRMGTGSSCGDCRKKAANQLATL